MIAHIDLDVCLYTAGFAAQSKQYTAYLDGCAVADFHIKKGSAILGNGKVLSEHKSRKDLNEWLDNEFDEVEEIIVPEPEAAAIHGFRSMVERITEDCKAEACHLYLTGTDNFREQIATIAKYKGNRDDMDKPYHYETLRNYAIHQLGAEVVDGMEADDAMAIAQHADPNNTIICTIDKDLLQVVGQKYLWNKKNKDTGDTSNCFVYIDAAEGMRNFYTQLLTGDATDNIKGLSGTKQKQGIGPVKAKRLLAECSTSEEYYNACLEQYVEKYGDGDVDYKHWNGEHYSGTSETIMLENAKLLWMQRYEHDYDFSLDMSQEVYGC